MSLYPFIVVKELSDELTDQLPPETIDNSWEFIQRMKDYGEFEWVFWFKRMPLYISIFIMHSTGGLILTRYSPQYRPYYFLIFSLSVQIYLLTLKGVAWILLYAIIFYIIVKIGQLKLMWASALILIFLTSYEYFHQKQVEWLELEGEQSLLAIFTIMMCLLRMVSFGAEYCDSLSQTPLTYSFPEYLLYIFYLPLFATGPVLTYDKFCSGLKVIDPYSSQRIRVALKKFCLCFIYAVGLEIFFHFCYAPTISQQLHILEELHCGQIASLWWLNLNIFCVKYYIFYRGTGLFAELDGFDAPDAPKCIASLYTFGEMWRTFDRGLYMFLQRYIYHPLGGSKHGLM